MLIKIDNYNKVNEVYESNIISSKVIMNPEHSLKKIKILALQNFAIGLDTDRPVSGSRNYRPMQ